MGPTANELSAARNCCFLRKGCSRANAARRAASGARRWGQAKTWYAKAAEPRRRTHPGGGRKVGSLPKAPPRIPPRAAGRAIRVSRCLPKGFIRRGRAEAPLPSAGKRGPLRKPRHRTVRAARRWMRVSRIQARERSGAVARRPRSAPRASLGRRRSRFSERHALRAPLRWDVLHLLRVGLTPLTKPPSEAASCSPPSLEGHSIR
jgi:hypothetical protein